MVSARERAYVWLSMTEGLGPRRLEKLLLLCDDVQVLMGMSPSDWRPAVDANTAARMQESRGKVDDVIAQLEKQNVHIVTRESKNYPQLLLHVYDPPVALYVRGRVNLNHPRPIAMVGSRNCTRYGKEMGYKLARELAEQGVCVVSGLARGIDTVCHEGALSAKGATFAVLGCGLNVVYPPENVALYARIPEVGGALISEYLPDAQPYASHFPLRNRIISGMCSAVALIEAAQGSGAMITVDYALEHGRDIFALPGNVTSRQSVQPNRLLRDGATMLTCAQDVMQAMNWEIEEKNIDAEQAEILQLSMEETAIVEAAYDQEVTFEELLVATKLPSSRLNSLLTMLTLRGIMDQSPGRVFHAKRK